MRRINPAGSAGDSVAHGKGAWSSRPRALFRVKQNPSEKNFMFRPDGFDYAVRAACLSESITVREDKETVFDSALRVPCKCAPETLAKPAELVLRMFQLSGQRPRRDCSMFRLEKTQQAKARGDAEPVSDEENRVPFHPCANRKNVIPPPDSPPSRTKHQAPSPAADETAIQKRRFTAKTRSPPLFRTPRGSTATGRCASAPACFRRTGRGRRPRVPPPRSAPA